MSLHITSTQFDSLTRDFVFQKFKGDQYTINRVGEYKPSPLELCEYPYTTSAPGWMYVLHVTREGKLIAKSNEVRGWRINSFRNRDYAKFLATLKEVEENE